MSYYYKNGHHKTFLEVFNNYYKEVNALNNHYVNEPNISKITDEIFIKDTVTFKLRRTVGVCFNNSNSYNYKIKNLLKYCFDDFSKIDSNIPNGTILELKSYVKDIDKVNSLENKVCEELFKYNAIYKNGGNYEGQPYIGVYKNNKGVLLNNVQLKEFVTKYQNEIFKLKKKSTIHYFDAMIYLARNNNQDELVKRIKTAKYKIN